MKSHIISLLSLAVIFLTGCDKNSEAGPRVKINGASLTYDDAKSRIESMLSGNLNEQQQAVAILKDNPQFVTDNLSKLVAIAKKPIDYTYANAIHRKANSTANYVFNESDPRLLEIQNRMELRKASLELAIGVDSKDAFEIAKRYAASSIPADANIASDILRNYRFQKGREETGLPPAWFHTQMLPANEYAVKIKAALSSKDADQRQIAFDAFSRGLAKDLKFPNLSPFLDYFNDTAAESSSNSEISQTRQTITSLLSQSEDPRVYPFLTNAIKDNDPAVADAASRALEAYNEWNKSENQ